MDRPHKKKAALSRRMLIAASVVLLIAGNAAAIRDAPFVPPSRLFFDPAFSVRLMLARQATEFDIVILGNSRARSALSPSEIAQAIAGSGRPAPAIRSLAAVGGYPAFYQAAFGLGASGQRMPRLVILGVTPRDFDEDDTRKLEPYSDLVKSSGYKLETLPYQKPFAWLEALFADGISAGFPFVWERDRLIARLFPESMLAWIVAPEESGRIRAAIRTWFRRIAAESASSTDGMTHDFSWGLARYRERLSSLIRWRIEPREHGLDIWGGELDEALAGSETDLVRISRVEAQSLAVAGRKAECGRFNPKGAGVSRLLQHLERSGVEVILVQPPYLAIEPCEMRFNESGEFANALNRIAAEHANIRLVLNYAEGAGAEFRRAELFSDPDHMTVRGAVALGHNIGAQIAKNVLVPPR